MNKLKQEAREEIRCYYGHGNWRAKKEIKRTDKYINKATLLETKRCAKVAREVAKNHIDGPIQEEVAGTLGEKIAKAIES